MKDNEHMATLNPIITSTNTSTQTATDFNVMQAKIARILGTGDGDYGYGQTVTSSPVVSGTTIAAQHWIRLINDLHNIRMHQKGEVVPAILPEPGVNLVISNAMLNLIKSTIDNAVADRLLVSDADLLTADQYTTNKIEGWPIYTAAASVVSQRLTHTVDVEFGSAENLRWFFNSGSVIEFTAALTGIPLEHKSYAWSKLLSENLTSTDDTKYGIGRIVFSRNNTTSINPITGLPSNNGISYAVGGQFGMPNPIYKHGMAEAVAAAKADLGSSTLDTALGYGMYHAGYQYQFGITYDGKGSFYSIVASAPSVSSLRFVITFNDSTQAPAHSIDETLIGGLYSKVTIRRSSYYIVAPIPTLPGAVGNLINNYVMT